MAKPRLGNLPRLAVGVTGPELPMATLRATMSAHPAATDHVPWFIAGPGEADILMVAISAVLIAAFLGVGILFFRLHSLPERMAHRSKKLQVEVVAVLCLLALFTHVHLFWVAALILALIDIPDFGGAFNRMAASLEKMAGRTPERREAGHVAGPSGSPYQDAAPLPDRARAGERKERVRA
jgi:hypothetical protein